MGVCGLHCATCWVSWSYKLKFPYMLLSDCGKTLPTLMCLVAWQPKLERLISLDIRDGDDHKPAGTGRPKADKINLVKVTP